MKLEKSAPAPTLRTLDERRDERRRRRRILLYSPALLKHHRNRCASVREPISSPFSTLAFLKHQRNGYASIREPISAPFFNAGVPQALAKRMRQRARELSSASSPNADVPKAPAPWGQIRPL
jgi:hypothetical protein